MWESCRSAPRRLLASQPQPEWTVAGSVAQGQVVSAQRLLTSAGGRGRGCSLCSPGLGSDQPRGPTAPRPAPLRALPEPRRPRSLGSRGGSHPPRRRRLRPPRIRGPPGPRVGTAPEGNPRVAGGEVAAPGGAPGGAPDSAGGACGPARASGEAAGARRAPLSSAGKRRELVPAGPAGGCAQHPRPRPARSPSCPPSRGYAEGEGDIPEAGGSGGPGWGDSWTVASVARH